MKEMLEKHRIKRNVLFWGKQALQMIKLLLLFAIGYGVLFNLGNLSLHKICETAYFYGMIIGIMFAFVEAISYFSAYMPLVISFGSTRKGGCLGHTADESDLQRPGICDHLAFRTIKHREDNSLD